jgi:hypothetical protein
MNFANKGWLWLALGAGVAGCSGKLIVFDAGGKEVAGMPFRTAEVYVKQGTRTTFNGAQCEKAKFHDIVALPTGSRFYVSATSSAFAKTAFKIKYNDAGGVSEVGLDSEPAGAENIKAVAELIKTVVPLAGIGAARSAAAGIDPGKSCDVGETNVTYEPLENYLKRTQPAEK